LPTLADALLAAAWIVLLADALRRTPRPGGVSLLGRLLAVAALAVPAVLLERLGGRAEAPPAIVVTGLGLVAAGLVLYARALRALGPAWAVAVQAPRGGRLVDRGPYARVRHPAYLGLLLVVAGTLAAHPSLASAALALGLATGIAAKIRAEERVLRDALGEAWERYATRVPPLIPRLGGPRPRPLP
jgi:protein-S-isoprenylcysteine O-methyltransferase Ste14